MQDTFVIVGAGMAGATAALTLRAEGFDGRVVMFSDEPHLPYSRPPLSKEVVRGEKEPERALLRAPAMWESKNIEIITGNSVVELDVDRRRVTLANGAVTSYASLLLATGGRPRTLPGTEGLDDVMVLRTWEHSTRLRDRLGHDRSLLIIGAGFIGAELAASARASGTAVTLLEAEERPLARVLPAMLGEFYADIHREHGVSLHLGIGIDHIEAAPGGGALARAVDGREFVADTGLVAVGLIPNTELAARAGIPVDNGIIVDEYCRTGVSDVYAAGDVANHPNPILGHRCRIEHWQNAQHQGMAAARNMLGMAEAFAEVPWVWSDQYDLNLQIAGLPRPTDEVVMRGDTSERAFIAFLLREGRLAAAVGVNSADEVHIARDLIGIGLEVDRACLADPGVVLEPGALRAPVAQGRL